MSSSTAQITHSLLYGRAAHGAYPVRVLTPNVDGTPALKARVFEVLDYSYKVRGTYDSASSLLQALTGKSKGWSFDRYFRTNREEDLDIPQGGSILDLFQEQISVPKIRTPSRAQKALTVAPEPVLGIDLQARGHEVRKLFFKGFGYRVQKAGFDPEEILQEIYRGILTRNNGKCPFDGRKSSFGHYVHMVCECILNNYHRKETRHREMEQVGVKSKSRKEDDLHGGMVDAAQVAERVLNQNPWSGPSSQGGGEDMTGDALRRLFLHLSSKKAHPKAFQVAQLLLEGYTQKEISKTLGYSQSQVSEIIQNLRQHMQEWTR